MLQPRSRGAVFLRFPVHLTALMQIKVNRPGQSTTKKNSLPSHWQATSYNPNPDALLHVEKLYLNKVMDQEVHPANQ